MHWPGANFLMITGTIAFTFCYVPAYFITRIKRPELKFNTIVNSVLMFACGGILFAMFNLKNSQFYENAVNKNHDVLQENTKQLISSNDYLDSMNSSSLNGPLHALTDSIMQECDRAMSKLESNNQVGLMQAQGAVKDLCERYNGLCKELNMKKIKAIDFELLNKPNGSVLQLLGDDVGKTFFLRIKQQVAVNENSYLIAYVIK